MLPTFDQDIYPATETEMLVQVCVSINTNLLQSNVTLTVHTEDDTAVGMCTMLRH